MTTRKIVKTTRFLLITQLSISREHPFISREIDLFYSLDHPCNFFDHPFCSCDQLLYSREHPLYSRYYTHDIRNEWESSIKTNSSKLPHKKALVAFSFSSVISPLVTFRQKFFLRNTPQIILDLMTSFSSLCHVWGPRKRVVRHTHTQTDFEYYICIYRYWRYIYSIASVMCINSCALIWKFYDQNAALINHLSQNWTFYNRVLGPVCLTAHSKTGQVVSLDVFY